MHLELKDNGSGVTRDSLAFFRDHRHELTEVISAAIWFPGYSDPYDPYNMVIHDDDFNQMWLSGCTCGYVGEGPRGAMQVLVELGFDPEQARQVFTCPELMLNKNTDLCPTIYRAPVEPAQPRVPTRTRSMPARHVERDL